MFAQYADTVIDWPRSPDVQPSRSPIVDAGGVDRAGGLDRRHLFDALGTALLFSVTLVLVARAGYPQLLWRTTCALMFLTYADFFLKYTLAPPESGPQFFDYRLINRTLLVLSLLLLGKLLELWLAAERDRHDPQLPPEFVREEQEFNGTLAVVCGLPLFVLVAAVDFFTPASINGAILYPVPLFLMAWTHSRRWMWFWVLLLAPLPLLGFYFNFGSQHIPPDRLQAIWFTRLLVMLVVIFLAGLFQSWFKPTDRPAS